MSSYLKSLMEYSDASITEWSRVRKNDIAVIGMWGEFGTAQNPAQFWESLCQGKDLGRELPKKRAEDMENYMSTVGMTGKNAHFKQASYMENIDQFDYSFFGISPKEASLIDPSQRIFLQTVWHAIEDSGYNAKSLAGKDVGIYIGYTDDMLYKQQIESVDPKSVPIAVPGNVRSMIGGRISYLLDLHGPSVVIDTACSSALVAAHTACRAIQCGDCELAIVGSTKIFLNPLQNDTQFLYEVMSVDDKTRSYDAEADGFGLGEGTGAIILKALDKAIKDRDNIYAVIKGSAVTQDGTSIGMTAPNIQAQEEVLRRAWRESGISPDDIDYVEGHGTATALGDAVELQALGNMLREYGKKGKCILGSVKSNIGHLDHAAGMAGIIKLLLMLKNKQIPPMAHFKEPNSMIDAEGLPIHINNELLEWNSENKLRTCCISSFGLSGTNCHMVLQEYNSPPDNRKRVYGNLFTLSAKTKGAFRDLVLSYIEFLKRDTDLSIGDICYTANVGREHYQFRLAIPCVSREGLLHSLESMLASGYIDGLEASGTVADKRTQEECNDAVSNWKNEYQHDSGLLHKIGRLYCAGADIHWDVFYNVSLKRVSLPVYPFSGTRCWCETGRSPLYHEMTWKQQDSPRHVGKSQVADQVVIVGPKSEFLDRLMRIMAEHKKLAGSVEYGAKDRKTGKNEFLSEDAMRSLIESTEWKRVTHIVFCLPSVTGQITTDNNIGKNLENGVYAIFRFIKKLLNHSRYKCQFILIGYSTYGVCTDETELYPENAASYGMGRVVNLEYPHIICRCLDISADTEIRDVYQEIVWGDVDTFLIALRGHQRYIQIMRSEKVSEQKHRAVEIKKNGVYIITGGTGELGLRVCQFFSECQEIQLVLIGREPLPSREDWGNKSLSCSPKISSCIETIQKIEKLHTKVSFYSADVSNEAEIAAVIEAVIQKFGKIDGIVHCAGIPGDGFLMNKEEVIFREVLAPKVEGTWLLHSLTREYKPDFLILFSSVTAITGAPGQSDYCAANSFLNAFSEYRNLLGFPTLSITWTKWKGVGMGDNYEIDLNKELFRPLNPDNALIAFGDVWDLSVANIVVGEVNPCFCSGTDGSVTIEQMTHKPIETTSNRSLTGNLSVNEAISLNGKGDKQGYTYYEKLIATIWKEVLGYDTFSIHDSFFDIGGDSLKIRSVYLHMEELLPGKITIVDLFDYSTIFQLARFLDDNHKKSVKKTGNLSDELYNLVSDLREGKHSLEEIMERYNNLP